MTTNQASGGVSSNVARAQGLRHSAAVSFDQAPPGRTPEVLAVARAGWSVNPAPSFDLGVPRGHPLGVGHAVWLAVVAGGDRGLPQRDRLEVGRWGIGVVQIARAGLQLVHERAR